MTFTAATGIIAEFNPLHSGHKLLIDKAKENGNTVICVISGNFVQRGDTAVISKTHRAKAALLCGADLVAELPVLWSMSTAQNFALGGVSQAYHLGCDEILFGSECGDIDALYRAADVISSDEFFVRTAELVKNSIPYAVAREQTAVSLGVDSKLLSSPNDNLGIEYILAAKRLRLPISFRCIKRSGAGHDSTEVKDGYVSSSLIRNHIISGRIGHAERYMPPELRGWMKEEWVSDVKRLGTAILAVLRTKTESDFALLPDISEGIENKLAFSVRLACSLDELYDMVKTKHYTSARVRRLVLSAFLGYTSEFFMVPPPYVRVLGFNASGTEHLKKIASFIPIISRVSQIKDADDPAVKKVFSAECRASDLYALSLPSPQPCGNEYTSKIIKLECSK